MVIGVMSRHAGLVSKIGINHIMLQCNEWKEFSPDDSDRFYIIGTRGSRGQYELIL